MTILLGWLLLIAGIVGIIWVLRSRAVANAAAGRSDAPSPPGRGHYAGVIAALVVGLWFIAVGAGATSRLALTHEWDFSQNEEWLINNSTAIQWDEQNGELDVRLESGSGAYAVYPVDWDADAFSAEFDIQVRSLNSELSVIGVGLFDGAIANIHDRDHIGGSTLQASFGRSVRLEVSDANLLSRSDPIPGSVDEEATVSLDPGKVYRAVLGYHRRIDTATLDVREKGGSQPLIQLRVEELRDFTPNVAYFGVSIKGYDKGKTLDPNDPENPKPIAEASLDNIRFLQP